MNSEDLAIRSHQLNAELLEKHPAWGAYDEDDSEVIRPILSLDPFAEDCDPITIRADFETAKGAMLQGCVVIDRALDDIYLIEVFQEGVRFGFNVSLTDLAEAEVVRLQIAMRAPGDPIFPVKYRLRYPSLSGETMSGVFSPF